MRYLLVLLLIAFAIKASADTHAYEEIHGNGFYTTADRNKADRIASEIRDDVAKNGMPALARRAEKALDGLVNILAWNLRRAGYDDKAYKIYKEWKQERKYFQTIYSPESRKIGDFKPLSEKLAEWYEIAELILGYERCRILRISDIKTINYTVPVVFKPCNYDLQEFTYHFVHDEVPYGYKGLMPVLSYWGTVITCSIATYGAGYFFVCSPIGMLVELGVDRYAAPWLAPKIYNMVCGG